MRGRTFGVLAALLPVVAATAVVGGVGGSANAVAVDQSYWVPVDKRIVVHGHGYGHGHGMSQYGAQGAAMQGKSYSEIINFYYPGTDWSRVRGRVRVLITADTSSDVVVSPTTGLTVRDLGDRGKYRLPIFPGITRWRLNVRDGRTVVEKFTDRWRRFRPGGKRFLVGDGEFFAPGPLTLSTPSGSKAYRGILRAASPRPGASDKDTVNVLSMDEYVRGVVPYEMPASWHPEAVKAQSIAARTYATWERDQNRSRYYQICDTTACQVYGGATAEDPRSNRAVAATAGQILTYDGKPAFTQFSASSGGWTSQGSVPYLPAQEDPFDGWSGNSVHSWSTTVDAGHFERAYPALGTLRRIVVVNRDGNGEWQGRVNSVVLDGTKRNVTISGDDFRWAFNLRSSWFTIEPTPIIARWTRIGGNRSRLGDVTSKENAAGKGSVQAFERGRIFYSRRTGARELYGPILSRYRKAGSASGELGLPKTPVQRRLAGQRVLFQGGSIWSNPRTGTVLVSGRISRKYVRIGSLRSGLGWPTRTNYAIRGGERVNFENGRIVWWKKTNQVRVRRYG